VSKKNRYSKALKQLKSTRIEEKIKCLDEALPTNHTTGLYSLNARGYQLGPPPPEEVFYPDQDGNWSSGVPGVPGESSYTRLLDIGREEVIGIQFMSQIWDRMILEKMEKILQD